MIDLEQFKENIREHGMMCEKYCESLDSFVSNKQLADIAMGVQAFDTLCIGIAEGWGISPEYICARFKNFINGKYVSEQKGYTSKLYCKYNGDIVADTTTFALIDSDVNVNIPDYAICKIYCTGKCNVNLNGGGNVILICYGNPENTVVTGTCGKIKRINGNDR